MPVRHVSQSVDKLHHDSLTDRVAELPTLCEHSGLQKMYLRAWSYVEFEALTGFLKRLE